MESANQNPLTADQLPIYAYKRDIIEMVSDNLFCVLTGDTGSGKSTQLPQYIYDSFEIYKSVYKNRPDKTLTMQSFKTDKLSMVVTQPRRVAAMAMARRVCEERGISFGNEISYAIRFDDRCTDNTKLRYVTDGILVRECLTDPDLNKYNIVILDEAHERSIYTDILFSLVKKAVIKRNGDLRLIVTSATLNTDQFARYFNNCPVLKVEGRCYPVEILHGNCSANKRVEEAVRAAIRMHLHEGPGDILVFLPGSEDCEMACKLCISKLQELISREKEVPSMVIYPLYGAQNCEDQARVFEKPPEHHRKLIFSTNIAETSLTIDGIGFVIDSGYVKQKCYNPRTGMDALLIVPISKVQAIQRAGRAGRTQAGKCYRMFSEQFFKEQMVEYTIPEILRTNLASTILTLKSMGIHDVMHFEFMEPPDKDQIFSVFWEENFLIIPLKALKQLYLLGALDENGRITDLGHEMTKLPIDVPYAKALIASLFMGCDDDILTIVSLLSSENIWSKVSRTNEKEYEDFQAKQADWGHEDGDHVTYIRIYEKWRRYNYSKSWAEDNFLNFRALKQGQNIKLQIGELLHKVDLKICEKFLENDPVCQLYQQRKKEVKSSKSRDDGFDRWEKVRMALTAGFYFNSARKLANSQSDYLLLSEGNIVNLDPQCVFAIKGTYPEYLIFTELGGTTIVRGIMRITSRIDSKWVKDYIARMKEVDTARLADIKKTDNDSVLGKRANNTELEVNKEEHTAKRNDKIEEAKRRALERKKIKK